MLALLYLKWIANKDLLYSTWNSPQCHVASEMGGEFGGEWVHIYVYICTYTHTHVYVICIYIYVWLSPHHNTADWLYLKTKLKKTNKPQTTTITTTTTTKKNVLEKEVQLHDPLDYPKMLRYYGS